MEKRFELIPDDRKKKPRRKSVYGLHLEEKQKVKFIYGVLERQLARYAKEALKRENSPMYLLQELETRLDNVVYRLGYAQSRQHARQLVSHYHVMVNAKKHNISSYLVKAGDTITLSKEMYENPLVKEAMEKTKSLQLPSWLSKTGNESRILAIPSEQELPKEFKMDLVMSFFV